MQDYTFLRELAGSFGTIFLVVSFLGFVLFALRPGSRKVHSDIANIPFRHDDKPAPDNGVLAAHIEEDRK